MAEKDFRWWESFLATFVVLWWFLFNGKNYRAFSQLVGRGMSEQQAFLTTYINF